MKKILSILLLAVGLVSCDDIVKDNPVETPEYVITNIEITGSGITAEGTATLTVGTTLKLAAEITPKPKKTIALVWKSSNEELLEISKRGLLKAKKAGTVVVTVSAADYPDASASITVTIVDAEADDEEGTDDDEGSSDDDEGSGGDDEGSGDDDEGSGADAEVDVEEGTCDQSKAEARS